MALSPRRLRFVAEYSKDFNATQAAIRAGYSPRGASTQGMRLLATADIRAKIDQKAARVDAGSDFVLRKLREIASDDDHPQQCKALELLGKNQKLWTERVEVIGLSTEDLIRNAGQEPAVKDGHA